MLLHFIQITDSHVESSENLSLCNGTTSIIHINEPQHTVESSKLIVCEATTPSLIVPEVSLPEDAPVFPTVTSHKEDSHLEKKEDTNSTSIIKPSESNTSYHSELIIQ